MPRYNEIDWKKANCQETYTDLFYQVEEERSMKAYFYINAVRMICGKCEIWDKCLQYAFNHEEYGVWGGLTSLERESFRKPEKYERQRKNALSALTDFGIDEERLNEIYEYSLNEPSMADKPADNGEDDFASDC